ncbi:hypothetical protein GX50_01389 [[Emmonsia] crescens]|uniref:Uncharacterized protein n=1 Tax=[Emmonsia] crescens TaxID=73230 RepID=A0A2B7ZQ70_9EURO|nr:hypothetical protein GX50_01389 [Emmonsia crescens]
MIRPWISILLLALVLISSVSAVDLGRGRQARSDPPFAGFKALSVRLRSRDKYLDDSIARRYEVVKRQNNSDPITASPPAPDRPNSTPPDINTPADTPTPTISDHSTIPTPPQTPTTTKPDTTIETPPPETTKPTTPPQNSTTPTPPETITQTPPESTNKSSSNHETTSKTKPPPTTPTLSPTRPPPQSVTTLIPTTNPDGSPTTITSIVVVQPTNNAPGGNPQGPPGLQTNTPSTAAAGMETRLLAVLGLSSVIAVAILL